MRSAAPGAPANAPPLRVHLSTTFLADLLLFPANSVDEWPCLELFAERDAYLRAVLHSRAALRHLDRSHPELADDRRATVPTGPACCYVPDDSITWLM